MGWLMGNGALTKSGGARDAMKTNKDRSRWCLTSSSVCTLTNVAWNNFVRQLLGVSNSYGGGQVTWLLPPFSLGLNITRRERKCSPPPAGNISCVAPSRDTQDTSRYMSLPSRPPKPSCLKSSAKPGQQPVPCSLGSITGWPAWPLVYP